MAKGMYIGVDGVARTAKQPYIGVNNVARKVTDGYIGVDNVARKYFSAITPIGELECGTVVKGTGIYNRESIDIEYTIVNQGIPSITDDYNTYTEYDESCDDTWLMANDTIQTVWDATNNDYENSDVHAYLNTILLNSFHPSFLSVIKQVKIPYVSGTGTSGVVKSGADGLLTWAFLPSFYELGKGVKGNYDDGNTLECFPSSEITNICYTRTPRQASDTIVRMRKITNDETSQSIGASACTNEGIWRYIIIVPRSTLVDPNNRIIIE